MPQRVAEKLDRAAARLGLSKRDVLAALVSEHLAIEGDEVGCQPRSTPGTASRGESARAVLNLAEAADLLRVAEHNLQALAESGEIPGRRIGSEWRFSRAALLHWLGGGGD